MKSVPESAERDRGLRIIVIYKIVRAVASWIGGAILLVLVATGRTAQMHDAAVVLRDHMTHAISLAVARFLVDALTARHIMVAAVALAIDGGFAYLEGWALHRRFWWGPWLILIATAALLPFEVVLLIRRFRFGRVIVFVINLAIFIYIARRTWREHTERNTVRPEPSTGYVPE